MWCAQSNSITIFVCRPLNAHRLQIFTLQGNVNSDFLRQVYRRRRKHLPIIMIRQGRSFEQWLYLEQCTAIILFKRNALVQIIQIKVNDFLARSHNYDFSLPCRRVSGRTLSKYANEERQHLPVGIGSGYWGKKKLTTFG